MAEGLQHWLNDEANLNINVHSFEKEFSNGYYLGKILFNFGLLPTFFDHFQNKPQPVYRNTHFDLIKPALAKVGINFDDNVQLSIKKEELGAAKKLLFKLKAELSKMKEKVDFTNKANMTEATWSIHQRTRKMNMCPKNEKFEQKLVPFEEEFLRQKQQAKSRKEQEEKKYQDAVKVFRDERRQNLITNHNYMLDWENNLDTLWKHSRGVMQDQKDHKVKFNHTMTDKIRHAEDKRTKQFRDDCIKGIRGFEENANRLGIELYHDPDRTDKVEKAPFNLASMMEKVKAKGELNEVSRKQKESRQRYLKLKQARTAEEMAHQKDQQNKLDRYVQKSKLHLNEGADQLFDEDVQAFVAGQRERQYLERKAKQSSKMEDIVKGLKVVTDEEYRQKNREVRFNKQVAMFQERKKKYDYHYHICRGVFDSLFEMSDACLIKLESTNKAANDPKAQVPMDYFKLLLKKFVGQETMYEEAPEQVELKSTILTYTKMKNSNVALDIANSEYNYNNCLGSFSTPMTYEIIIDRNKEKEVLDYDSFAKCMYNFVNIVHPMKPMPTFAADSINLVPLRLCILGDAFVGKKTVAKKLSSVLNIPIIDINALMQKAKGYIRSEEKDNEEGNPGEGSPIRRKPAAGAKPGAFGGKKPADTPVALNETELEFQKIGVKIKNLETAAQEIPDELKIDLILLELKPLLPDKKFDDIKKAFGNARKNAEDKKTLRLTKGSESPVPQGRGMGKDKSAAKVGLKEQPQITTTASTASLKKGQEEEIFDEIYPYTKGYILVNFPSTVEQANALNKRLTNYVPLTERLNPQCEEMKERMRKLIPVPEVEHEKNSFPPLDFVFILDLKKEQILERASKIKIDPTTGVLYDPIVNPPPEADKKLLARLEHVKLNQEIIEAGAEIFDRNRHELHDYFTRFGFEGFEDPVYQEVDANLPPTEVEKEILNRIKHLLKYKYSKWYESKDGLPQSINSLIELPYVEQPDISDTASQKDKETSLLPNNMGKKSSQKDLLNLQSSPGNLGGSGLHGSGVVSPNPYGSQSRLIKKSSFYSSGRRGSLRNATSVRSGGNTKKERFVTKCLDAWESIFDDYVTTLERNIRQAKENFEVIKFSFENSQRQFVKIFKEKKEFSQPIINFVETYKKFVVENPDAINSQYCKDKMYKKIEQLHDTLWKELSQCKDLAKAESSKSTCRTMVINNISNLSKFVVNLVANELNKIFHMKNLLCYYFGLVNEATSESQIHNIDLGSMEIRDEDLPKANDKDLVPIEMLNYVRDKAIIFLNNILKTLEYRRGGLPKELYMSLKTTTILARQRVESVRAYAIHKMMKFKSRYTLIEQRFEEWMIYSIKTRNGMIYDLCNRLKECVKEVGLEVMAGY